MKAKDSVTVIIVARPDEAWNYLGTAAAKLEIGEQHSYVSNIQQMKTRQKIRP